MFRKLSKIAIPILRFQPLQRRLLGPHYIPSITRKRLFSTPTKTTCACACGSASNNRCCKGVENATCCQNEEQFDSELDRIRAVMDRQRDPSLRAEALQSLESLADSGDAEAQYLIGIWLNSLADKKNSDSEKEASDAKEVLAQIEKAKKAAKLAKREKILKAKSKAMLSVVDHTEATTKDQAIHWLERAVSLGHSKAMIYLANIFLALGSDESTAATEYYTRATSLYEKASASEPDALYNLGMLYFEGRGEYLEKNLNKSLEYFKAACAAGDVSSMFWMGYCYMTGEGGVGVIRPQSAEAHLLSAAKNGHPKAIYYLALVYKNGLLATSTDEKNVSPDGNKFKKYLDLAVKVEDPDGIFCLSDCYLHGTDGYEKNVLMARQLLEKSVSLNHCESIVSLGAIFYHGIGGVKQDLHKAFELYNQAAELGSKEAWKNLASMYFLGEGVPQSKEIAMHIMKTIFDKEK